MDDDKRWAFYPTTVTRWIPDRNASILVVAGGVGDHIVFRDLGYTNVTISNMDTRTPPDAFAPFSWRLEDAQRLSMPDNSYDYVVEHAGLHHLHSPHMGLIEMYRVARRGVLFFEARDSAMLKLARRLNLVSDYEHAVVFAQGGVFGGVNNTGIPNYIYRWTEREVEKTIASFNPAFRHAFRYRYGASMPYNLSLEKGILRMAVARCMHPFFVALTTVLRRQGNQFAAMIDKPHAREELQPWLELRNGEPVFDTEWGRRRYKASLEDAYL